MPHPRLTSTHPPRSPCLALLTALLLSPGLARAQLGRALDPPSPAAEAPTPGWALDLSLQTSLPLSVGLEAQLESPIGLFASLSIGHTPSAYLDAVASALADAGAYPAELQPLVEEALGEGAWNARASLGVRLVEGLELSLGYTYLRASAGLRPATIQAATGQAIRWPGLTRVPLLVEVHALHVRLGWRFVVEEHLVLRVAVGWTQAVSASARVEVPDAARALPGDPATRIEEGVAEGFGTFGFTPELLLGAGYRF